ncbi:hypothetical protein E2C01_005735 [Portunus trituberculatus]|uniref:Uncharacterized protein n=1 Tax=Portunus trituberculatus TaxID=210409 RepID=A0A5B7CT62_PORTR|nr:hypothetical protein [Portunus trituberculatus]
MMRGPSYDDAYITRKMSHMPGPTFNSPGPMSYGRPPYGGYMQVETATHVGPCTTLLSGRPHTPIRGRGGVGGRQGECKDGMSLALSQLQPGPRIPITILPFSLLFSYKFSTKAFTTYNSFFL